MVTHYTLLTHAFLSAINTTLFMYEVYPHTVRLCYNDHDIINIQIRMTHIYIFLIMYPKLSYIHPK